jgi:hypothetical protein
VPSSRTSTEQRLERTGNAHRWPRRHGRAGADIPWSIKNDTIRGNLVVAGQTEEWIGSRPR